MCKIVPIRIPVCNCDGVIVERVDRARARRLAMAINATVVRKRNGEIVRINMGATSDDSLEDSLHGNPLKYSHNHETETNPEKVWTIKRIPAKVQCIFQEVVTSCLKAA